LTGVGVEGAFGFDPTYGYDRAALLAVGTPLVPPSVIPYSLAL